MAFKNEGSIGKIEIVNYSEELKESVKTLNVEWLEKYFKVEPIDVIQLSHPTREIINKGGMIFYAKYNSVIVGTASLLKIDEKTFELGKMAVTESAQGFGIGKALMDHCFKIAAKNNIQKLVLYSNTKLSSAIHIYKKYGFTEIILESGHYERANIKMEKTI
ncbi:MAG: GNAT family N-acetyltransferase [Bacteroidetes bacterium]|nr:GNAT family N-acetyltransferase [Bacteroidota bacterium]